MLNRELMTSRKFRSLGWAARTIYCATYPFADRDGRLPGDPEECWAYTGAAILIDAAGFAAVVREIVESGLWIEGNGPDGEPYVEIRAFAEAQSGFRYDREKPGRWDAGPTPESLRTNSGSTPEQVRTNSGLREENGSESESEREENGNGVPARHTIHDIRAAYARAFEEVTKSPALLKPADIQVIQSAIDLGTLEPFPDLEREFVRTLRGLKSKNLGMSCKATINCVGGDWIKDGKPKPEPRPRDANNPFGNDPATGRPYHPGA